MHNKTAELESPVNLLKNIDPFPLYASLRAQPVRQIEPDGIWAITRYDDVVSALRQVDAFVPVDMPAIDRAVIARATEGMFPAVQPAASALVERTEYDREINFLQDFAYPYAERIVAAARQPRPVLNATDTGASDISASQLNRIALATIAQALCNAVALLGVRPDIVNTLRGAAEMTPRFVEEMLRYHGPTHRLLRRTSHAVYIGGARIPADATVALVVAAANRDPAQFRNPDSFDMRRDNIREHLAFGIDAPMCGGAAPVRQAMRSAIDTLLKKFSRISCPPEQQWQWSGSRANHVLLELPVRFI
jgi:cytochrome P450